MKPFLSFSCLIAITILSAQAANADIARPKPTTEKPGKVVLHTSLEIVPDTKLYEARLQISQSDLQNLRAALDGTPGNTTIAAGIARSSTRTIVAGVLLFLSVSFAGVWLARSTRSSSFHRTQKTVAVVIILVAVLGAAAIITRGNAGPPGYYRWRNLPQNLSQGRATSAGLDIEVIPDDPTRISGMKLIIPIRNLDKPGEE